METHHVLGIALVAAGGLDFLLVAPLLRERVTDPAQRRVVFAAVAVGGAVLLALGALFLLGLAPV